MTKSKISSRASKHQTEDVGEGPHIVATEEAGATEAEEATVEVEAVGEDGAAHEAIEVFISPQVHLLPRR